MLISIDEIQKSISKKGWKYDNKKLKKTYELKNFSESIKFVNEIANKANSLNHHPEININFNQVEIKIGSVELNGVTTKCVNLAIQIDNLCVS
jgi:4a-hydroxytetrahydrobiopterin dehydratase